MSLCAWCRTEIKPERDSVSVDGRWFHAECWEYIEGARYETHVTEHADG